MERIDEFIRSAKSLPPAPRILPQLMQLLRQTDVDSSKVVDLVTFDPALTAKILQVCNSAAYAGAMPVADLREALLRLGFAEIFRIVASVIGEQALGAAQAGYGIGRGELWEHSAVAAVAAQIIAQDRGLDPQQAFTAGLLHDVGKIVLAKALEGSYERIIEETDIHQQSLVEAEKAVLGVDHAQVGGRLLAQWKFPEPLVEAVTWHHDPSSAENHQPLAACVYLANMIAAFTGHGYGFQAFALRGRAEALESLGLQGDELPLYMIRTTEGLKKVSFLAAA
ncbi:MAG: HDOD domain-containing protein [Verrucomicrobia bacterium]|nr:HDOD domain-containing protein [Verrucomicrobiota bacterium]MBI3869060.1 HDOD domain-containing protein [Verrucomicrobiota bacterium]